MNCTCKMPRVNDMPHDIGCPVFFGISTRKTGQTTREYVEFPPMKPEATLKEELKENSYTLVELTLGSERVVYLEEAYEFIESLLSSSQALAREELLHENELATTWLGDVKKSLQKEKTRLRGEGVDLRLKPIWQSIHAGIFSAQERWKFIKTNSDSALQEKLDTKGE